MAQGLDWQTVKAKQEDITKQFTCTIRWKAVASVPKNT